MFEFLDHWIKPWRKFAWNHYWFRENQIWSRQKDSCSKRCGCSWLPTQGAIYKHIMLWCIQSNHWYYVRHWKVEKILWFISFKKGNPRGEHPKKEVYLFPSHMLPFRLYWSPSQKKKKFEKSSLHHDTSIVSDLSDISTASSGTRNVITQKRKLNNSVDKVFSPVTSEVEKIVCHKTPLMKQLMK